MAFFQPFHSSLAGAVKSQAVTAQLRGHELRIPDLRPIYANWAEGLNSHFELLSAVSMKDLEKVVTDKKQISKARALDAAFFTSTWFPETAWNRLDVLTTLVIWVFLWDDEIDDAFDEQGLDSLIANIDKGELYREKSLAYIDFHLGLTRPSPEMEAGPEPPTAVHSLMGKICQAVREACDRDVVTDFREALAHFINGTGVEQRYRLDGYMPSMPEYWDLRLATVGSQPMLVLAQYASHVKLPREIVTSAPAEAMRREFTRNIILLNDLLSFKKEVKEETIISLIPVMLEQQSQPLSDIVDACVADLADSSRCFDRACAELKHLVDMSGYSPAVQQDTEKYIKVFETMLTGCLRWSLKSRRYGMAELLRPDGSLVIHL